MSALDLVWEAQIHREVYIAILNSALKTPGSKQRFAERVGITPQYLSYLLDPYNHRTASPDLAKRISDALPLPGEQRLSLQEHLLLARERRLQGKEVLSLELTERSVDDCISRLRQAHQLATFATHPSLAKKWYRLIYEVGGELLGHLHSKTHSLAFVEVCLLLHDVQCVLNRPDSALYCAKLARSVIQSLEPRDFQQDRELFDTLEINAIRAEAVAYHNLHLYQEAYDCCLQAHSANAMKNRPELWKPHLYRDMINALSRKPRFAISEAEGLANQIRAVCEHRGDDFAPLLLLLSNRSLGEAYIEHGSLKKARRVLRAQLEQITQIPNVGPLHRTLFLRTYGKLLIKQGDSAGWDFIRFAVRIAHEAGLCHQIMEMRQEYGSAVGPSSRVTV